MAQDYARRFAEIKGLKLLMNMKMAGITLPTVLLSDGSEATAEHFKFLLVSYGRQAKANSLSIDNEADAAAEELDQSSLQTALEEVATKYSLSLYSALLFPYCRFASARQISTLLAMIRKWSSGNAKERKAAQTAQKALLLSDTREAMLYADKQGLLDCYAEIRGTNADTIRDCFLSDIGLDEHSGKSYDLGNQTVIARLQKDLSFLIKLANGKTAKSLPKKGADTEKYEAANKDFSEMKKSVKKILKNRFAVLFADFLSGKERPSDDWQESYLRNPLLREAASLVVWSQGKKTFTLTASGAIDSAEHPYTITDEPIKVAHPMEMSANDIISWQKYFANHGLKQPFAQVWEPVRKPEEITKDRYADCYIPYYRFLNQEKHGISVEDYDFHNEIIISFKQCKAVIDRSDYRRHDINVDDRFEVREFSFEKYTRQVNHIVAYLDRVTVRDRVRKDDITVMDMMPGFTLAQITEFITEAQEANAINVLAALMEYKSNNFADFDPMDEFTPEW